MVSIVSHLAGIPGYDWDRDQVLSDYVAEVDSVSDPYMNHRAARFVAKKLLNKGFNWHFPMHVALSFDIENGHITARKGLVRDFDGYYERISHADEKRLLKLLEDFYQKSDFDWYDSFFGPRNNSSFKIHLRIITGPANYAARQRNEDS